MQFRHEVAEPYAEHAKSTHQWNYSLPPGLLVWGLYAFGSVIGLPGNVLVICISFFNKENIGDYKIGLTNTALLNVVYGTINLLRIPVFILWYPPGVGMTVMDCTVFNWLLFIPPMSMIYALPITSFHRCCVILWNKEYWVTKGRLIALCVVTWLLPLTWPLGDLLTMKLVENFMCGWHIVTPFLPDAHVPLLVGSILTCVWCNWRLYWGTRGHIVHVKANLRLPEKRVKAERALQRCAAAQALCPLLSIGGMIVLVARFAFVDSVFGSGFIILDIFIAFLYGLNPIIDVVVVLVLLKPYRREFNRLLFKCMPCFKKTNTIAVLPFSQYSQ